MPRGPDRGPCACRDGPGRGANRHRDHEPWHRAHGAAAGGYATITRTIAVHNGGGGILLANATLTINDSATITWNTAYNEDPFAGGGGVMREAGGVPAGSCCGASISNNSPEGCCP